MKFIYHILTSVSLMILSSAALAPVVKIVWNFSATSAFHAPTLGYVDTGALLFLINFVSFFTLKRVEVQYVPTEMGVTRKEGILEEE